MIAEHVRRGLLAGVVAGLIAGVFALVLAEPHLDAAIAVEQPVTGIGDHGLSRWVQKAGMIGGMAVMGMAIGALFGIAAAWAVGRLAGEGWIRSLKLGSAAIGGAVLLPALAYPPNPPGAGNADEVAMRGVLHLAVAGAGVLLAVGAWLANGMARRAGLRPPARTALVGTAVLVLIGGILATVPAAGGAAAVPAGLLRSFRLSAIGTQVVLYGATAGIFGLLTVRAERRQDRPTPRSGHASPRYRPSTS